MPDQPDDSVDATLERKLATILSADVAGYSRLMAEDEEQTLIIFRGHRKVFDSLIQLHRGRIFNTAGDAVLAEFASAVEAVRCATEVQAALHTRNEQFPSNRQVQFRIGINLGDVMVQGLDLLGDGVNVAARLQSAAEPGGICISGSVYDQIRNKLSLNFASLGERAFKNIPQPVRTFSIVGNGENAQAARSTGRFARIGVLLPVATLVVISLVAAGYWWSTHHQGDNIPVEESARSPMDAEETGWSSAQRAGTPAGFSSYLKAFPSGRHAEQAQLRIADLAKTSTVTKAFDGAWLTTLSCPAAAGAGGFAYQLLAEIKDGKYHGQRGQTGTPGWIGMDGTIQSDGVAHLLANGIVGASAYAAGNAPTGTEYFYHVAAQFQQASGTGKRVEGRPCDVTFVRQ